MAEVLGLAHAGIYVYDLERSKKFYEELLGMTCVECVTLKNPDNTKTRLAFMEKGTLSLELVEREVGGNPGDGVIDHVAVLVDDIEGMRSKLQEKGIRFEQKDFNFCAEMFAPGTKWIFFRGPDNERIELVQKLKK